jgi:hypothetical protein
MPPDRKHYAGPARTLQHRDEEKPCNYKSSLRSTFINPEEHTNFFPSEGPSVVGRREQARIREFKAIAEAEAQSREDSNGRLKTVGTYSASSHDAQRHHGEDTYKEVGGSFDVNFVVNRSKFSLFATAKSIREIRKIEQIHQWNVQTANDCTLC